VGDGKTNTATRGQSIVLDRGDGQQAGSAYPHTENVKGTLVRWH